MKERISGLLKKLLVNEILINFKACVYFFCVVFFYCVVQLCEGRRSVGIITLAQIVLTNYVVCYLQTYLFRDFDESDKLGRHEIAGIFTCTFLYVAASLLMDWFGGSEMITAAFAAFMVLTYLCVILCHMVRRRFDTRQLNRMLDNYKKNEGRD